MSRGVLYITWPGEGRMQAMLARSIAALAAIHPELPVHVAELPEGCGLLAKARMEDLSPFDETLFLDADTVVMERLDYGFEKARQHGIALCVCECPWARRFEGLKSRGDLVEYNTGVVFWMRGWHSCYYGNCYATSSSEVFDVWKRQAGIVDSSMHFIGDGGKMLMPTNDQASFALAVDTNDFNPFVLPLNWNFRPRWQKTVFGPVKIWHDYDGPTEAVLRWNAQQSQPDAVIQCGRIA